MKTLPNISKCDIRDLSYIGQSYHFISHCPNNGLIFISTAYHPGSQVANSNQKLNLYKANGNLMAIQLPKGESQTKLTFFPTSFLLGLSLSSVSLVAMLTILICYKMNFWFYRLSSNERK